MFKQRSRFGALAGICFGALVITACNSGDSTARPGDAGQFASCWANAWSISEDWLRTTDSGQVSQHMIDEFGAEPHNFHGVGLMGDPFVLYDQALYRMWFSATAKDGVGNEAQGIAYSESLDGNSWSDPKDAFSLIKLQLSPQDSPWQVEALETPSVVKVGGVYYLYFSGRYQDQAFKIGLATSINGYEWNIHDQPVLEASLPWELTQQDNNGKLFGGVLEPSVLYDKQSNTYFLWYSTFGMRGDIFGGAIGLASSKDGIHWNKQKTPVFEPGIKGSWDDAYAGHASVERDPKGNYHLFYAGFSIGESYPKGIGHAFSSDGVNWMRNPLNPMIETDSSWRTAFVGGPSSVIHDETMSLWYMGANNSDFSFVHFGVATSTCSD